ncbi:DoxX family membrane protein [bacterium]|nr:DoxX family membrane protein [bacterium]
MLISFIESFKYSGHLISIALLRMYIGYHFLSNALTKMDSGFLTHPRLAAMINNWLPVHNPPGWYEYFFENVVVEHWELFSRIIYYLEFGIGVLLIVGFLVRPATVVAMFLTYLLMYISDVQLMELNILFMMVLLALSAVGAGRCLGFDYYFFKRYRGFWW